MAAPELIIFRQVFLRKQILRIPLEKPPQSYHFRRLFQNQQSKILHPEFELEQVVQLSQPDWLIMQRQLLLSHMQVSHLLHHARKYVPHTIVYTQDIMNEDVCGIGRGIRLHPRFSPAGTNVDFVQKQGEDELRVRTYERGVEGETLACGTGVVASALLASLAGIVESPVRVQTQGGEFLTVYFEIIGGSDNFGEVFLEGSAKFVFEGILVEI